MAAKQQRLYLEFVPKKAVYGALFGLLLVAVGLFLFVPHYKPLKLASKSELEQAHYDVIKQHFVASTTCNNDTRSKTDRIITFNKYFKVNKYANRAVLRGCNDADVMLAKNDAGKWVKTDVNIQLQLRQNPVWQQACLIDDITKADTVVRPENKSIDANNRAICDKLQKESYIQL